MLYDRLGAARYTLCLQVRLCHHGPSRSHGGTSEMFWCVPCTRIASRCLQVAQLCGHLLLAAHLTFEPTDRAVATRGGYVSVVLVAMLLACFAAAITSWGPLTLDLLRRRSLFEPARVRASGSAQGVPINDTLGRVCTLL